MQSLQPTPALPEFPQLSRLPCFSARNQGLVADYLAHLRARHYTPAMQEATIRALKSFAILRPEVRQATLYHDLTQTTPTDIDAWSEASFRRQLAPGTIAPRLRVVQGFFAFLRDQGALRQSPIRLPAITSACPKTSPAPWRRTRSARSFVSSIPCGTARCCCGCCGVVSAWAK
jgi:hypothetical protein